MMRAILLAVAIATTTSSYFPEESLVFTQPEETGTLKIMCKNNAQELCFEFSEAPSYDHCVPYAVIPGLAATMGCEQDGKN